MTVRFDTHAAVSDQIRLLQELTGSVAAAADLKRSSVLTPAQKSNSTKIDLPFSNNSRINQIDCVKSL